MLIPFGYKSIIIFGLMPILSIWSTILLGKWWNRIAYHGKFHHKVLLLIFMFISFTSLSVMYFGILISILIYFEVIKLKVNFIYNFFIVIDFYFIIQILFLMIISAIAPKFIFISKRNDWYFGDAIVEILEDITNHTEVLERLLDDDSDDPKEATEKLIALFWIFSFPSVIFSARIFKRYRNGKRKF